MNKRLLPLIWSILCVPFILFIGYILNIGLQPVFLWIQLICVLSGIYIIAQISINHLALKILAVGLYVSTLLFFWLTIAIILECNNSGHCFVH